MTQDEYEIYLEDFSKRFPSGGRWLIGQPDTLQSWFEDCFSCFELEDCIDVNRHLFTSGEDFQWGELPRVVMQTIKQLHTQPIHDTVQAHIGVDEHGRDRTFKCPRCQDTEWISLRDAKGRRYAGPCGYCEAGRTRHRKYTSTKSSNGKQREIALISPRVKQWEY